MGGSDYRYTQVRSYISHDVQVHFALRSERRTNNFKLKIKGTQNNSAKQNGEEIRVGRDAISIAKTIDQHRVHRHPYTFIHFVI
jgi:hypothetical protein